MTTMQQKESGLLSGLSGRSLSGRSAGFAGAGLAGAGLAALAETAETGLVLPGHTLHYWDARTLTGYQPNGTVELWPSAIEGSTFLRRVGSSGPIYVPSGLGGGPSLRTGADCEMRTDRINFFASGQTKINIFLLLRPSSERYTPLTIYKGSSRELHLTVGGGTIRQRISSFSGGYVDFEKVYPALAGIPHLLRIEVDRETGRWRIWQNRDLVIDVGSGGSFNNNDRLRILYDAGEEFVDVGMCLVVGGEVTPDELRRLYGYIGSTWSVDGLPSGGGAGAGSLGSLPWWLWLLAGGGVAYYGYRKHQDAQEENKS